MNEIAMKPFRLKFPGELEGIFMEDYFHKSLNQLRFSIGLATLLYILFGVLDALIFPEVKVQTWIIRYAVVSPVCISVIVFSYSRHFKRYMQIAVFLAVITGGAGIIAMMVLVRSPINYFHFAGLLLVLMYSFTFSKLRFVYTTIAAWIIVGLYEVAALWIMRVPLQVFLNDNFFFFSANLIGMFSCYQRERYTRKDYLQNKMVKEFEEKNHLMEKEGILRDLHDGIGSIATNIGLLAELAQKSSSPDEIRKMLATISELSREELEEIRRYLRSLDARELSWQLLTTELRSQGRTMIEPHGVSFDITTSIEGVREQPGSLLWLNLFRIYKESLTNIIKHSRASAVKVSLRVGPERLELAIADNGRGFSGEQGCGRGISHMTARAQQLGGMLTVTSGSGITVRLALPLPIRYSLSERE